MKPPFEEAFPRPSVIGVVNVTPDSFSDGGAFLDPGQAIAQARRLLDEGAALVDVGGESTRPGSEGVSAEEELRRVEPVLEGLAGLPVSIDTSKSEVARRALELGAVLVNDVTALRSDPGSGRRRHGRRRLPLPHAHARRAADDAGRPPLRRRGRGGFLVSGRTARSRRGGRDPGRPSLPRSGHRIREDGGAQPRAAGADGRAGRDRQADLVAPRGSASSGGFSAIRRGDRPRRGRSRGHIPAYERGASLFRVHDVRENVEALAAARSVVA